MKDPASAIRKAYYNVISGNVTYNGVVVEIYDEFAPKEANYPHIIFSTQSYFQRVVKNCNITDATILFEVVSRDYMGKKVCDDVCAQLIPIITEQELDLSPDFICEYTELSSNDSFRIEGNEGAPYVVRQVVVRNLIEQV